MKKIISMLAMAIAIFTVSSCKEKEEPLNVVGTWGLTNIETKAANLGGTSIDVYIVFNADNTFKLYQMIGQGPFNTFSGTYTLTGDVLDGKYSDGRAWGSAYEVSQDKATSTLTLSSAAEIYTYKAASLPSNLQ